MFLNILFLSFVLINSIFTVSAECVMPPNVYVEMAQSSNIKAIAEVVKVEVLENGKHSASKKIHFRLIDSFNGEMPKEFTGTCQSIDRLWQIPMEGGTIYQYPNIGETVYVTVAINGGMITSYTVLNEQTKEQFEKKRSKIQYGIGSAWIEEN